MSTLKHLFFICLVGIIIFSCAKVSQSKHDILSHPCIIGFVQTYDRYGNPVTPYSNVIVRAECIDTIYDSIGNVKLIQDIIMIDTTDITGKYVFDSATAQTGIYFITFSKSGFNKNMVNRLSHNIATRDSLVTVYLANVPPASISFDAAYLSSDSKILYLDRKVMFNQANTQPCEVVTRYFFGKTKNVSDSNFVFQWVSGAVTGVAGSTNTIDSIRRSTDGLVAAGFTDTSTIYVRAYLDNFRYSQYVTKNGTTVFPNITAPSPKVMHVKLNIDTL